MKFRFALFAAKFAAWAINIIAKGRGTNLPGDGDFDFTIRHNLTDEEINEFHDYLKTKVPLSKDGIVEIIGQGFRIKGAILPSGE